MSQIKADSLLTLAALNKVLGAQRRGTISDRIHIRRYPTQVVIENVPDKDMAWFAKHFPGERERTSEGVKKTSSIVRWDIFKHVSPLRSPLPDGLDRGHGWPRLEVWGLLERHVCRDYQGRAGKDESGRRQVTWRCGAYGCGKKITKTAARDLGLLP